MSAIIVTMIRATEINQVALCHEGDVFYLTMNKELIPCTEPQDVFKDINSQLDLVLDDGREFICIEYTHAE